MPHPRCLTLPHADKARLRFMFLAKHALGDGSPHPQDGNHAIYHHEILTTLRAIGLQTVAADSFSVLYERPNVDFLVTLFNRAGFRNSEMMAPLLAEMHGLPYLGGAPMIRGLSDDKHFLKRLAQSLGVQTPPWRYYPMGGLANDVAPDFNDAPLIVKPNASSASWGVLRTQTWQQAREHIDNLHRQGHDVIVERWIDGAEINLPVVGAGAPWFLPAVEFRSDSGAMRSYEEKRGLIPTAFEYAIHDDPDFQQSLRMMGEPLVLELWPFDHGRIEFCIEYDTGRIWFIEANLNCNLWSRKAIPTAARHIGVSHEELLETIICHSLMRQNVIARSTALAA